jgi:hypothetical protein
MVVPYLTRRGRRKLVTRALGAEEGTDEEATRPRMGNLKLRCEARLRGEQFKKSKSSHGRRSSLLEGVLIKRYRYKTLGVRRSLQVCFILNYSNFVNCHRATRDTINRDMSSLRRNSHVSLSLQPILFLCVCRLTMGRIVTMATKRRANKAKMGTVGANRSSRRDIRSKLVTSTQGSDKEEYVEAVRCCSSGSGSGSVFASELSSAYELFGC